MMDRKYETLYFDTNAFSDMHGKSTRFSRVKHLVLGAVFMGVWIYAMSYIGS